MCWLARAKNCAHGPRAGLAQGLEQPLDHGAEQLVGLQVQAAVASAAGSSGGACWRTAGRSRRTARSSRARMSGSAGVVPGQCVQVALDDGGGVILAHRECPHRYEGSASTSIYPTAGVHPPRSGISRGGERSTGSPRPPGVGPIAKRPAQSAVPAGDPPGPPGTSVTARRLAAPGKALGRLPSSRRDAPSRGCPPVPDSFGGSRREGRPRPARVVAPARPRAGRAALTRLRLSPRELGNSRQEASAVDGTRSRRMRDEARRAWYARHRQRRFARFLGFGDRARPAASPPAAGAGRAPAAASTRPARDARRMIRGIP